jgi:hypothetical protein
MFNDMSCTFEASFMMILNPGLDDLVSVYFDCSNVAHDYSENLNSLCATDIKKNGGNIVIATNGQQKPQSKMSYNTFACLNVCYGGLPQEMICKGCMETSKEKAIRKRICLDKKTRMTQGRQGRHVNNLFTRSGEITTIKRSN